VFQIALALLDELLADVVDEGVVLAVEQRHQAQFARFADHVDECARVLFERRPIHENLDARLAGRGKLLEFPELFHRVVDVRVDHEVGHPLRLDPLVGPPDRAGERFGGIGRRADEMRDRRHAARQRGGRGGRQVFETGGVNLARAGSGREVAADFRDLLAPDADVALGAAIGVDDRGPADDQLGRRLGGGRRIQDQHQCNSRR
jgi:hypothetical protein